MNRWREPRLFEEIGLKTCGIFRNTRALPLVARSKRKALQWLDAGRLFEADPADHQIDQRGFRLSRGHLGEDHQAFVHRFDDAVKSTDGNRQVLLIFAPDERCARLGIDDDITAILGAVVHDEVEAEDSATRPRDRARPNTLGNWKPP